MRLGRHGMFKKILLGIRESEVNVDYLNAFIQLARKTK